MKKIFLNALILGLIIVLIAFVPDAGNRVLSWLVPPRLYILFAVIVLLVLYKILTEIRNRNNNAADQSPVSQVPYPAPVSEQGYFTAKDLSAGSADASPQMESAPRKVWSETVDNFLARNENAKLIKLTGKADDFASCEVGNRCHVVPDEDDEERYVVLCGDDMIGRLPSSAVTYANKHDCSPEDLAVIVADIDYDVEKDRDIISVYISD